MSGDMYDFKVLVRNRSPDLLDNPGKLVNFSAAQCPYSKMGIKLYLYHVLCGSNEIYLKHLK